MEEGCEEGGVTERELRDEVAICCIKESWEVECDTFFVDGEEIMGEREGKCEVMIVCEFDGGYGDGSLVASGKDTWLGMREDNRTGDEYHHEKESDAICPGNAFPKINQGKETGKEEENGKWQDKDRKKNPAHREGEEYKGENDNAVPEYEKGVIGDEGEDSFAHKGMVAVFPLFSNPARNASRMRCGRARPYSFGKSVADTGDSIWREFFLKSHLKINFHDLLAETVNAVFENYFAKAFSRGIH